MEYVLTFKLWQSWLFLFVVALVCIFIGYLICRFNFYNTFVDSYKRSRGKSTVSLTSIEIGYLKNLLRSDGKIFIVGGTKLEREGMVDYIRSFDLERSVGVYYGLPTLDTVSKYPQLMCWSIFTVYEEPNLATYLSQIINGLPVKTIVYIDEVDARSVATVYVYNESTKEFTNVVEHIKTTPGESNNEKEEI